MKTAAGRNRTEYSFATPIALERIAAVLTYIEKNPGSPSRKVGAACHISGSTVCTYLTHLAQKNRAHSLAPPKGQGLRWYAGPNVSAQPAKKKIKGERIVNIVRAADCRMPQLTNDPLMAMMFGGRR